MQHAQPLNASNSFANAAAIAESAKHHRTTLPSASSVRGRAGPQILTTGRDDEVHKVRVLALDGLRASAAFVAGHEGIPFAIRFPINELHPKFDGDGNTCTWRACRSHVRFWG